MKYKFLGKSDFNFPNLKTGKVYNLQIISYDWLGKLVTGFEVEIKSPFWCPYSSWETFYKNWKPYEKL